ncbi:hypothetical protein [Phenylobacterium sp.]|uniref:hypothetical protein n=1 Tax=Phenylobacterium sp. TaxID=1871053 RepID=UPI00398372AD
MATFTELVAAVVVQSSAVAFSHFGMVMEPPAQVERSQPVVESVIARTKRKADKAADWPQLPCARLIQV